MTLEIVVSVEEFISFYAAEKFQVLNEVFFLGVGKFSPSAPIFVNNCRTLQELFGPNLGNLFEVHASK